MNDIQELIEQLYTMVKEAWGLPLSSEKCVLERDKVLDLIETIQNQLPTEVAEAKRLVDAREAFITNAKREAENISRAAEERAKQLVNEQEIYRTAKAKSDEMVANAERYATEVKRSAGIFVDEMLKRSEETMSKALEDLNRAREGFQQATRATAGPTVAEKIDVPMDEAEDIPVEDEE